MAQYLRRDCLEISGIPALSEDFSTNDIVIAVGKVINVSVKEDDISASHPLPSCNSDAPPKIIVKFTRRDVRNVFYANRRKLVKTRTNALPDLGVTDQKNIHISESLTPFKKKLLGEVNKVKKRLRWKHIWTQNGRIFVKEAERTKPVYIDSRKILNASMAVKSCGLFNNLVLIWNSISQAKTSRLLANSISFKCTLNFSCNLCLHLTLIL